jgi:phosphate transport system substrate-binding protein
MHQNQPHDTPPEGIDRRRFVGLAAALAAGGLPLTSRAAAEWAPGKTGDAYVPYTNFDLSGLPAYTPTPGARVVGVVRVYGTPLENIVGEWAYMFDKIHGQARLVAHMINTSQGMAGLVTGEADLGIMGHATWHTSRMAFKKVYGYEPLAIRWATGSYDDPMGWTQSVIIMVHKSNPLERITIEQLDGIFGSQRTGCFDANGTAWTTACARGADKNIRTWGQIGLTGEWANKPISLQGSDVTISNWADLMDKEVFQGSYKWAPHLVESPRADIAWKANQKNRDQFIIDNVVENPYAIGFGFQKVINKLHADVKIIPVARTAAGPYVLSNPQTQFDMTYPLHNGAWLYVNRPPGKAIPTKDREFLRLILSREGQQIVANGRTFIPLNAAALQAELKKLD